MSRTMEITRPVYFRANARRYRFYSASHFNRARSLALEGVLSALLVTVGLIGGIFAVTPQEFLAQIPVVHVGVAFFVPFATLFALTDLHLSAVTQVVVRGFLAALMLGGIFLVLSLAVA